jgi:hypothetical protein
MYLIPSNVIGGRVGILLRTYTKYIVGNVSRTAQVAHDAAALLTAARCRPWDAAPQGWGVDYGYAC